MDVLGPDGYVAAVAGEHTPMGRGHMLLAVAMAAPAAPDATVGAVMAEALADDNPYVRRYALLAAGVLGWDDLLAAAAAIATTDPEPAVRATAAEVLADR
jgi:HEAT repeat protein